MLLQRLAKTPSSFYPRLHHTLKDYLRAQSVTDHFNRDDILSRLTPIAKDISINVISKDGACGACNHNFYHMDNLSLGVFRDFMKYKLHQPDVQARGFMITLRTIPRSKIEGDIDNQLSVVEKLTKIAPNRRHVQCVVDEPNVKTCTNTENYEWCQKNKDKTFVVTDFTGTYEFMVRTFDKITKRTPAIRLKYIYDGLDDLLCIYLSLLLPNLPRILSQDLFRDHVKLAYGFEAERSNPGFGLALEQVLSNVRCTHDPDSSRNRFYQPSSCLTRHHIIVDGFSYCVSIDDKFLGSNL